MVVLRPFRCVIEGPSRPLAAPGGVGTTTAASRVHYGALEPQTAAPKLYQATLELLQRGNYFGFWRGKFCGLGRGVQNSSKQARFFVEKASNRLMRGANLLLELGPRQWRP